MSLATQTRQAKNHRLEIAAAENMRASRRVDPALLREEVVARLYDGNRYLDARVGREARWCGFGPDSRVIETARRTPPGSDQLTRPD